MAKKYNHIHLYYRKTIGNHEVMACGVTSCTHYIPVALAVDKLSVCWACGSPFELSPKTITLVKPRCSVCREGKKKVEKVDRLRELLESGDLLSKVKL